MAGGDRAIKPQTRETRDGQVRPAFDRSQSAPRGGSFGLVLLVPLLLVGAAAGLVYVGRENSATYILALLAVLGTIGVFSLFAVAAGILRLSGKEQSSTLHKALVDNAFEGLAVTDQAGRVFYANATYLGLIGA